jgi:hypothetical protein
MHAPREAEHRFASQHAVSAFGALATAISTSRDPPRSPAPTCGAQRPPTGFISSAIMENTAPSGCECCSLTSSGSKHSLPSEENRDSCFLLSLARSLAQLLLTSPRRYRRAPPNPSLALCLAAKSVADLALPPPSLDPAATVLCPQRRAVLTPPPPCSTRSKVDLPLPSSLLLSPCP